MMVSRYHQIFVKKQRTVKGLPVSSNRNQIHHNNLTDFQFPFDRSHSTDSITIILTVDCELPPNTRPILHLGDIIVLFESLHLELR